MIKKIFQKVYKPVFDSIYWILKNELKNQFLKLFTVKIIYTTFYLLFLLQKLIQSLLWSCSKSRVYCFFYSPCFIYFVWTISFQEPERLPGFASSAKAIITPVVVFGYEYSQVLLLQSTLSGWRIRMSSCFQIKNLSNVNSYKFSTQAAFKSPKWKLTTTFSDSSNVSTQI